MSNVYSIEANLPSVVIKDRFRGDLHVVPVEFFDLLVRGHVDIIRLESYDGILATIIDEWMSMKQLERPIT